MMLATVLLGALMLGGGVGGDEPLLIDHRFSPVRQYTLLNYPFDWQKTILLADGALAYDFGPGPYHDAETEVSFRFPGPAGVVNTQVFADPLVPIATTVIAFDDGRITEDAFSLVPTSPPPSSPFTSGRVTRTGHLAGTIAWAGTPGAPDGPFRNVAWGTNRPITYDIAVPKGSRRIVALGICESYKAGPGQRVLEFQVEGAEKQTCDPIAEAGRNRPFILLFHGRDADGNGALHVEARCAPGSPDPNVILNALWVFPEGTAVSAESIAVGRMESKAEVKWRCGTELSMISPETRRDALRASFESHGGIPALTIRTRRPVEYDQTRGIIALGTGMRIRCSPRPEPGSPAAEGGAFRWMFPYPPGTDHAAIIIESGTAAAPSGPFPDMAREKARAEAYWRSGSGIPRRVICVPDSGLQQILDVNVRNLYQSADRVDGFPVFQPGPTVYRGLFLLDALMIGETLMLLGDTASTREYLEGTFRYQQDDGRVRVASPYNAWLETPVFVHALCMYARWSENREWLQRHWSRIVHGVEWIRRVRASTMSDSAASNFGLFPAGFVDGGLAGAVADFSTASFALAALEQAGRAASWLGHTREEAEWRGLFGDILQSYLHAARASIRTDRFGNRYLPVAIGDTSTTAPPQRGQYGFFMPLRLARYYLRPDPLIDSLIDGNLAMLDASLAEGMVRDAGWTKDAVWSWFGAMHAAMLSWRGHDERAGQMVYAVANHSGRLGTWVEEQQIRGKGTHSTGDGANAEAGAFFLTAVRNLLASEQDSVLRILPGIPASWLYPGARIAIRGGGVAGGHLNLEARVADDGGSLTVRAELSGGDLKEVALRTDAIREAGFLLPDRSLPPRELRSRERSTTWNFITVH